MSIQEGQGQGGEWWGGGRLFAEEAKLSKSDSKNLGIVYYDSAVSKLFMKAFSVDVTVAGVQYQVNCSSARKFFNLSSNASEQEIQAAFNSHQTKKEKPEGTITAKSFIEKISADIKAQKRAPTTPSEHIEQLKLKEIEAELPQIEETTDISVLMKVITSVATNKLSSSGDETDRQLVDLFKKTELNEKTIVALEQEIGSSTQNVKEELKQAAEKLSALKRQNTSINDQVMQKESYGAVKETVGEMKKTVESCAADIAKIKEKIDEIKKKTETTQTNTPQEGEMKRDLTRKAPVRKFGLAPKVEQKSREVLEQERKELAQKKQEYEKQYKELTGTYEEKQQVLDVLQKNKSIHSLVSTYEGAKGAYEEAASKIPNLEKAVESEKKKVSYIKDRIEKDEKLVFTRTIIVNKQPVTETLELDADQAKNNKLLEGAQDNLKTAERSLEFANKALATAEKNLKTAQEATAVYRKNEFNADKIQEDIMAAQKALETAENLLNGDDQNTKRAKNSLGTPKNYLTSASETLNKSPIDIEKAARSLKAATNKLSEADKACNKLDESANAGAKKEIALAQGKITDAISKLSITLEDAQTILYEAESELKTVTEKRKALVLEAKTFNIVIRESKGPAISEPAKTDTEATRQKPDFLQALKESRGGAITKDTIGDWKEV